MNRSPPPVAVIDIGSNSIKALVATRADSGQLVAVAQRTLDSRISTGISQAEATLSEAGMDLGQAAVEELLAFVAPHHPQTIRLVATSAVRDAHNGEAFRSRVASATGQSIQILNGDEEARLIGRGLLCDPDLRDWDTFQVFDLGGGSLECLAFTDRTLTQAVSLPLGCVRLTEKFVRHRDSALADADAAAVTDHVLTALREAAVAFPTPPRPAVFTGGTMTTCRAILAGAKAISLAETSATVTTGLVTAILQKLGRLPLAERQQIVGLPTRRADVMPVALVTVLALAAAGKIPAFQHSFYNLRWGLADALLPSLTALD